jgi:succinate dehydrogenase/fumarate reductase cytochrome b subunit (b558 family)
LTAGGASRTSRLVPECFEHQEPTGHEACGLSQQQSSTQRFTRERRAYTVRKLFSLTGVIPTGAFIVVYLWISASAMRGRDAFEAAAEAWQRTPYAPLLEVLLLWAPLALHAGYGLKIMAEARPSLRRAPYTGHFMYILQRATAPVALALLCYHGYRFRWPSWFGRSSGDDSFTQMCAELSRTSGGVPWLAIFYLIGLAAIVFHLSHGLQGFCFSWGITTSRDAARRAAGLFGVFGVLLYVVGASTVIYFATGSRIALVLERDGAGPPAITCEALLTSDHKVAHAAAEPHREPQTVEPNGASLQTD